MVDKLIIASATFWLLVLARKPPIFPQSAAAAAAPAGCPTHCRNGHEEIYTFTYDDDDDSFYKRSNHAAAEERTYSSSYHEHSIARSFRGHGCAAHAFVEFGAYRGGNRTFSIVGLASKPLHDHGHPSFSCEWIPVNSPLDDYGDAIILPLQGTVMKDYPDYGYGHAYTVLVITCTFDSDVGTDAEGGQLVLHSFHGDVMDRKERIVALTEQQGVYNASAFEPPYPYDFLYCGSPLFGRLNPRRVREWIAYHDMVFGERSHFVLYDAEGIDEAVREVLVPWMEMGRVSVQNVRATVHLDGHYFNQFLMVNDCVQRSKFLASWTFFFDLDEYLYVEPPHSLHSLLEERRNGAPQAATELIFKQYQMARYICHSEAPDDLQLGTQLTSKQWAIEKVTYRDLSSANQDVKYACNPRLVYSTGVHGVENSAQEGSREILSETVARYYHYHSTINMEDAALCEELSENTDSAHNFTQATGEWGRGGGSVQYDGTMVPLALMAKEHENSVLHTALN